MSRRVALQDWERELRREGQRAAALYARAPRVLHSECGAYTAELRDVEPDERERGQVRRFGFQWDVYHGDSSIRVGSISCSPAYNWEHTASISPLRNKLGSPDGYPRNPLAILGHDLGPRRRLQDALDDLATRAAGLQAWADMGGKGAERGPWPEAIHAAIEMRGRVSS